MTTTVTTTGTTTDTIATTSTAGTVARDEVLLDRYADVAAAFAPGVLEQLADDELPRGVAFMSGFLVRTNGEGHRRARHLITTNFFTKHRLERYDALLTEHLDSLLDACEAQALDGIARADLVQLLKLAQARQASIAVGLDAFDDPAVVVEAVPFMDQVRTGFRGADHDQDVEEVLRRAHLAKDELRERYILPAWRRREALVGDVRAGRLDEQDLPNDLLTVLVQDHSPYAERDPDIMIREYLSIFISFALSPLTVDLHSFDFAHKWIAGHPEDRQRMTTSDFVRDVVHETLRLRTQGALYRVAVQSVTLPSGIEVAPGQLVLLDIDSANRDVDVFGADAETFRIRRHVAAPAVPYGLTFGRGQHACVGKTYSLGSVGEEGRSGAIARVLTELFRRGVEPDPDTTTVTVPRFRPQGLPGGHLSRPVEEFATLPVRWRP